MAFAYQNDIDKKKKLVVDFYINNFNKNNFLLNSILNYFMQK